MFMKSFNLAHRDLKPDNILYKKYFLNIRNLTNISLKQNSGILKIGDFGKAKIGHN